MLRSYFQKRIDRHIHPHVSKMGQMLSEMERLENELNQLRSKLDVPSGLLDAFQSARHTGEYMESFRVADPLVTVVVATYNRAKLLTERCLPSLLRQTHTNLEIWVIGDACIDDTETRIRALGDSRIRFKNLTKQGEYPLEPELRWMVAGTAPLNHGLELAAGLWITHLDDDDEHAPDRVEKLLAFARQGTLDLVFHPFEYETQEGEWAINPAEPFKKTRVSTSSVFYHRWFARIPWDMKAYECREPGDWNRFRKIEYLGARIGRHPDCLLKHFRERNNK